MPTYDYKCSTCGRTFEYQQKMSDAALSTCPPDICENDEKGKGEVHRVMSKNIGLVFKGTGFYQTDYAHKSTSPAGGGGSKPAESKAAESSCACGTGACGAGTDAA